MKKIKNVDYILDLGGLKTIDGKSIKEHLLFRSAHLAEITNEEVLILNSDHNIHHVIDLRTFDEIKYRPEEHVSPDINYYHISLVPNELNPAVTKENRIRVLNELVALPGGMRGHILDLYKTLVNSEMAIEGYKKIFRLLLDNEKGEGFDIHCTQGKDRTGVVIYLILSSLGVSEKDIFKNYLSFNKRARFKRTMYFLGMNIRFSLKKAIALNDTLTARKPYFKSFVNEINKYGGVDSYLKNKVGLTNKDFDKLKQIYLQ